MRSIRFAIVAFVTSFAAMVQASTPAAPVSLRTDVSGRLESVAQWVLPLANQSLGSFGATKQASPSILRTPRTQEVGPTSHVGMLLAGLLVMIVIVKRRSGRRD